MPQKTKARELENLGQSGDYGQVANAPLNGDVPVDTYPRIHLQGFDENNSQLACGVCPERQPGERNTADERAIMRS